MQRRMSVPAVPGKSPGDKFGKALKTIAMVTPERASEIRRHVPKKRSAKAEKEETRKT